MMLFLLACAGGDDTGASAPRTSDHLVEFVSAPTNLCDGDELTLQAVFYESVPRLTAEVHNGQGGSEVHEVPFAGMDEDTGELYVHEVALSMDADAADDDHSTFSCDDYPYAGWRVYDDAGALMACYFGDFVVQEYDTTGCPE